MNKVNELYPKIDWILNKSGEIKKENYDACDSLVCALAYVNINRYGIEKPIITKSMVIQDKEKPTEIHYTMEMWGQQYDREITLYKN
jgi:hypothetical protein